MYGNDLYLRCPSFCFAADKGGDGGAADDNTADDKGADKKGKQRQDDKPEKVTMTKAELDELVQGKIDSALKADRDAAAKKKKDDDDEAARQKAEKDGEYKKMADQDRAKREAAEAERDAAKLSARRLEVKDTLRDHLAEKHPDYVGVAQYIMPMIAFDLTTDEKEINKQITDKAAQYVKDNPRKSTGGPPGNPSRQASAAGTGVTKPETNDKPRAFSNSARGF